MKFSDADLATVNSQVPSPACLILFSQAPRFAGGDVEALRREGIQIHQGHRAGKCQSHLD